MKKGLFSAPDKIVHFLQATTAFMHNYVQVKSPLGKIMLTNDGTLGDHLHLVKNVDVLGQ